MVGAGSAGCMVDRNKTGFQWLELVVLVVWLINKTGLLWLKLVVMVVWLVLVKLVFSGWSW